jgi:molybdenum cofactor synthesis domain-containing protein
MKISIIIVSDKVSQGLIEDTLGVEMITLFKQQFNDLNIEKVVIGSNAQALLNVFEHHTFSDYIITIGCTGLTAKDIAPQVTQNFCDKDLPGISEILRFEAYKENPIAMLSRNYAGIKGNTIIINVPASHKGVKLATRILLPILKPTKQLLNGHKI